MFNLTVAVKFYAVVTLFISHYCKQQQVLKIISMTFFVTAISKQQFLASIMHLLVFFMS